MSISVVGSASAAATSITLPAHQPGDIIVIAARGTAATPTIPSGSGSVPAWLPQQSGLANSVGLSTATFVARGSDYTSGTWTNATHIAVVVLRPSAGAISSNISTSGNANNTTTIVYPALTTRTDGTSTGVRAGTRGTAATQVGTPPGSWVNQVVQPASPNGLLAMHTLAALIANPGADSVTQTGTAAYRAHSIEIREDPAPTPTYTTLMDDFNRADGSVSAGAGAAIWQPFSVDGLASQARIISNALAGDPVQRMCVTAFQLQNDFDLQIDITVGGGSLAIYYCLAGEGTSGWSGYDYIWTGSSLYAQKRSGGSTVDTSNIRTVGALVTGDTVWLSKRGTTSIIYRRPSGGFYTEMQRFTDATISRAGAIGIQPDSNATTYRYDNLRAGPLYVPPQSAMVI